MNEQDAVSYHRGNNRIHPRVHHHFERPFFLVGHPVLARVRGIIRVVSRYGQADKDYLGAPQSPLSLGGNSGVLALHSHSLGRFHRHHVYDLLEFGASIPFTDGYLRETLQWGNMVFSSYLWKYFDSQWTPRGGVLVTLGNPFHGGVKTKEDHEPRCRLRHFKATCTTCGIEFQAHQHNQIRCKECQRLWRNQLDWGRRHPGQPYAPRHARLLPKDERRHPFSISLSGVDYNAIKARADQLEISISALLRRYITQGLKT